MAEFVQKLADPIGMIARIKSGLPKNCAVSRSSYCEIIISMRMQGMHFRAIEDWLIEQGPEHRISAPTIWRNLRKTKLRVELPYAEELAEQWGGRFDIDLSRELTGQVYSQRQRVDKLQRLEKSRQEKHPGYFDKRILKERQLLSDLIARLHGMMKSPLEAAEEVIRARGLLGKNKLKVSEDAASLLTRMILDGDLSIQELDEEPLH